MKVDCKTDGSPLTEADPPPTALWLGWRCSPPRARRCPRIAPSWLRCPMNQLLPDRSARRLKEVVAGRSDSPSIWLCHRGVPLLCIVAHQHFGLIWRGKFRPRRRAAHATTARYRASSRIRTRPPCPPHVKPPGLRRNPLRMAMPAPKPLLPNGRAVRSELGSAQIRRPGRPNDCRTSTLACPPTCYGMWRRATRCHRRGRQINRFKGGPQRHFAPAERTLIMPGIHRLG